MTENSCKHGHVKNTCTACYDETRLKGLLNRVDALKKDKERLKKELEAAWAEAQLYAQKHKTVRLLMECAEKDRDKFLVRLKAADAYVEHQLICPCIINCDGHRKLFKAWEEARK